jgi:hypothetical protein
MWPALLEKAYAQIVGGKGGYQAVGEGGWPGSAMAALTGVDDEAEDFPAKDDDVVGRFRDFHKAGKAVVCATLDHRDKQSAAGVTGAGDGPYHVSVLNDDGEGSELVPGSLAIYDQQGKAPRVTDDSQGKLVGAGAQGTVSYGWGAAADVSYPGGKGPAKAEDLRADYQWRGKLDKTLCVYANHAYIFDSVTDDGKLVFKNPWGSEHPLPMTGADFRRLYTDISADQVPRPKPAKKTT